VYLVCCSIKITWLVFSGYVMFYINLYKLIVMNDRIVTLLVDVRRIGSEYRK